MAEQLALDSGLYTLTPTHCGTGQASGAVDLPIARERHTGFPLIPATSLKGVVRDLVEGHRGADPWLKERRKAFLGTDPPGELGSEERLEAGSLVLTDGRLLAFPVRSLQAPYFWITCPLVVQRWERDRRALGLAVPSQSSTRSGSLTDSRVAISGAASGAGSLVLEDHFFEDVSWEHVTLQSVAESWASLLPHAEKPTRDLLQRRLVCVPDHHFVDLVQRATPINARVQLTGGKTTDKWRNPATDQDEEGNLWYEESLPSDCLFSVLATSRTRKATDLDDLRALLSEPSHALIQIGGNETVGQGLCWWRAEELADDN
jgi:CRISPR-associated protein Cmr4